MLHSAGNKDRRCGTDRRVSDRREGRLPAPHETLSAPHVVAAALLVVVIFGVDMMVPLGVGICFLYLAPLMFLAMYSTPNQSSPVIIIAAFSAMVTGLGFLLSPPGPIWHAVANRSLAIGLIGTTVMLSLIRKRAETEVKVLRGLLPICSYCKKIRDDGGYWQQVERYIAARSAADFSHGMCPDCGPKHFPDLYREKATKSLHIKSLGFFGKQEP